MIFHVLLRIVSRAADQNCHKIKNGLNLYRKATNQIVLFVLSDLLSLRSTKFNIISFRLGIQVWYNLQIPMEEMTAASHVDLHTVWEVSPVRDVKRPM